MNVDVSNGMIYSWLELDSVFLLQISVLAHLHCRTQIQIRTWIPNPIAT